MKETMSDQQPLYSLRWNNHQNHILSAFEALFQASTLVDVSLVCTESTIRAHKVVLSACSPFFQQIFSENPCKHPVIVLNEFEEWEIQALVDFMYKGEISVGQEQLPSLIKAADNLQIRGLAPQDATTVSSHAPTPSTSPHDSEPNSPGPTDLNSKLPHIAHLNFAESLSSVSGGDLCGSPLPRRKQARPRRRSGELPCPQDLSNRPLLAAHQPSIVHSPLHLNEEDTAEDLCVKRERPISPSPTPPHLPVPTPLPPIVQSIPPQPLPPHIHLPRLKTPPTNQHQPPQTHHHPRLKQESPEPKSPEQMDLSTNNKPQPPPPLPQPQPPPLPPHPPPEFHRSPQPLHHHPPKENYSIPPPPPPGLGLPDPHSPIPYPPMPAVTALAMTQPHSKFFGLDSPLGLFPPGLDSCRNPLLDLTDPINTPDPPVFTKKKMGRPKGQHSAPRGGPPRSWTNAELTEALQHVWNKKMTTSQASRIFGIPYNSLLMYVRGKYGKSLKLEQLRKDCTTGPGGPLELLGLTGNHHSPGKPGSERDLPMPNDLHHPNNDHHHRLPKVSEADMMPSPVFNHFPHNFYPDFGPGFPIPVSMIHLLPHADKGRTPIDMFNHIQMEEDAKSDRSKELSADEETDMFRPPVLSRDDCRRELIQQNGQD